MCFDFDLDPERRMHSPDFYGYIPKSSGKRAVVLYSMFIFTACHVAIRILGVALLAFFSPLFTVGVLGGDVLLFMLFKLARNDLRYWMNLPGALSWVVSFFVRLFAKLMVDFTVMVHLRHPQEIGGRYWCMCLLFGQATSFLAVRLHSGERKDSATSARVIWGLMGGLELAFIAFFTIFMATTNKRHRWTFFSTITAKQFRVNAFRDAKSDQMKMNILKFHPSYFASIRGEVKEWVKERFDTWVEEKPEWFTERVEKKIPIDMIPKFDNKSGFPSSH